MKFYKCRGYQFKLMLASGDGEYPGCVFTLGFFGWLFDLKIPQIIKPDILKVRGEFNYDKAIERQYGISLFDNHLSVRYGRGDANFHREKFGKEQRISCFLPWTQWRQTSLKLFGLSGEVVWQCGEKCDYSALRNAEDALPKASFSFRDFDGEEITATTFIEERTWQLGVGKFKWISWFTSKRVRRVLKIKFSSEVGPEKGSWKGGTVGHAIEMRPGENHARAFWRYCLENNLTMTGGDESTALGSSEGK